MDEQKFSVWRDEIEAITQRIVDLHNVIEEEQEPSGDRRRLCGALLHGVRAMNTAKVKLFTLKTGHEEYV